MKSALAAAAALAFVPLTRAWNLELPPCLDEFKPFVKSGCFADEKQQALIFRSSLDQQNMAVDKCVADCKGNGFRYAGLKYYGVCFCGSTVNAPQVDDAQCSLPCSGNASETCGGHKSLSIWQDPTFSKAPQDVTVEAYKSLGCHTDDSAKGRTLSWPVEVDAATFTTKACLAACEKQGFPFAGTEYGGECWCGVVLANYTAKVDDKECNVPCKGDGAEKCGGPARLNLYVAKELESLEPCGFHPGTTTTTSEQAVSTTATTGPPPYGLPGTTASIFTSPGGGETSSEAQTTTSQPAGETSTQAVGESTSKAAETVTTGVHESTAATTNESTTVPAVTTYTKPAETFTQPESSSSQSGRGVTTHPYGTTSAGRPEESAGVPGATATTRPEETTRGSQGSTTAPVEGGTTTGKPSETAKLPEGSTTALEETRSSEQPVESSSRPAETVTIGTHETGRPTQPGEATTSSWETTATGTPGTAQTTGSEPASTTTPYGTSATTRAGETSTEVPGVSVSTNVPGDSTWTSVTGETSSRGVPGKDSSTSASGASTWTTGSGRTDSTNSPGETTWTSVSGETTVSTNVPGTTVSTHIPTESTRTTTAPSESTLTTVRSETVPSSVPGVPSGTTDVPSESLSTHTSGESTRTTEAGETTWTTAGDETATSWTQPGATTPPIEATATTATTKAEDQATWTNSAVCTATSIVPAKCEWQRGSWCAPPLPEWNNKLECQVAARTCALQVVSCFKYAGWPHSIDCFDFQRWCGNVQRYCSRGCVRGKCGKGDCWKTYKPGHGKAPVTTTVFPCATPTKMPATTAVPTTSCPPVATNICKQPSNEKWGYSPGKPVGGIPLPVVGCNDIKHDWTSKPFKLYTEPDSARSPSFRWHTRPRVCAESCAEQYRQCRSTYFDSCQKLGWKGDFHKRREGESKAHFERRSRTWSASSKGRSGYGDGGDDDGSCAASANGYSWGKPGADAVGCWGWGGNTPDRAEQRCKAQYADCVAVNKRTSPGAQCETWCYA